MNDFKQSRERLGNESVSIVRNAITRHDKLFMHMLASVAVGLKLAPNCSLSLGWDACSDVRVTGDN